jgi:hypothetical protein
MDAQTLFSTVWAQSYRSSQFYGLRVASPIQWHRTCTPSVERAGEQGPLRRERKKNLNRERHDFRHLETCCGDAKGLQRDRWQRAFPRIPWLHSNEPENQATVTTGCICLAFAEVLLRVITQHKDFLQQVTACFSLCKTRNKLQCLLINCFIHSLVKPTSWRNLCSRTRAGSVSGCRHRLDKLSFSVLKTLYKVSLQPAFYWSVPRWSLGS